MAKTQTDNTNTGRVIWLTRHPATPEQRETLAAAGYGEIVVPQAFIDAEYKFRDGDHVVEIIASAERNDVPNVVVGVIPVPMINVVLRGLGDTPLLRAVMDSSHRTPEGEPVYTFVGWEAVRYVRIVTEPWPPAPEDPAPTSDTMPVPAEPETPSASTDTPDSPASQDEPHAGVWLTGVVPVGSSNPSRAFAVRALYPVLHMLALPEHRYSLLKEARDIMLEVASGTPYFLLGEISAEQIEELRAAGWTIGEDPAPVPARPGNGDLDAPENAGAKAELLAGLRGDGLGLTVTGYADRNHAELLLPVLLEDDPARHYPTSAARVQRAEEILAALDAGESVFLPGAWLERDLETAVDATLVFSAVGTLGPIQGCELPPVPPVAGWHPALDAEDEREERRRRIGGSTRTERDEAHKAAFARAEAQRQSFAERARAEGPRPEFVPGLKVVDRYGRISTVVSGQTRWDGKLGGKIVLRGSTGWTFDALPSECIIPAGGLGVRPVSAVNPPVDLAAYVAALPLHAPSVPAVKPGDKVKYLLAHLNQVREEKVIALFERGCEVGNQYATHFVRWEDITEVILGEPPAPVFVPDLSGLTDVQRQIVRKFARNHGTTQWLFVDTERALRDYDEADVLAAFKALEVAPDARAMARHHPETRISLRPGQIIGWMANIHHSKRVYALLVREGQKVEAVRRVVTVKFTGVRFLVDGQPVKVRRLNQREGPREFTRVYVVDPAGEAEIEIW